jgi:1,4-alpha-glucan branching enzyme
MRFMVWVLIAPACVQATDTTPSTQHPAADSTIPTPPASRLPLTTTSFGANVTSSGVVFRVWAPHATAARTCGDFAEQKVAMSPEATGVFAVTIADAHAGNNYWFELDTPSGTLTRIDPYCRQALVDGSACTVVDPSAYAWKSAPLARAARSATVVYELHVGSFVVPQGEASGTFASTGAALAPVADLGANVIELMPIQSYGGKVNGWGYNPQLYFAPKAGLGGADDLRALVDSAHGQGIGCGSTRS